MIGTINRVQDAGKHWRPLILTQPHATLMIPHRKPWKIRGSLLDKKSIILFNFLLCFPPFGYQRAKFLLELNSHVQIT